MPVRTTLTRIVPERTNRPIRFTIMSDNGSPFTPDTLVMTLYDESTETIIRAKANVLNTAGITVNNGAVTWQPVPEENRIVDDQRDTETHVMLWEWTWSASGIPRIDRHEIAFSVKNMFQVS